MHVCLEFQKVSQKVSRRFFTRDWRTTENTNFSIKHCSETCLLQNLKSEIAMPRAAARNQYFGRRGGPARSQDAKCVFVSILLFLSRKWLKLINSNKMRKVQKSVTEQVLKWRNMGSLTVPRETHKEKVKAKEESGRLRSIQLFGVSCLVKVWMSICGKSLNGTRFSGYFLIFLDLCWSLLISRAWAAQRMRSYEEMPKGNDAKGKGNLNEKGKGRGNVRIQDLKSVWFCPERCTCFKQLLPKWIKSIQIQQDEKSAEKCDGAGIEMTEHGFIDRAKGNTQGKGKGKGGKRAPEINSTLWRQLFGQSLNVNLWKKSEWHTFFWIFLTFSWSLLIFVDIPCLGSSENEVLWGDAKGQWCKR